MNIKNKLLITALLAIPMVGSAMENTDLKGVFQPKKVRHMDNFTKTLTSPVAQFAIQSDAAQNSALIDTSAQQTNLDLQLLNAIDNTKSNDEIRKEILRLLSQGADVNAQRFSSTTPLCCALARLPNPYPIVKILLEQGADVMNKHNDFQMYLAVNNTSRDLPSIKLIVEAGAEIDQMSSHDGATPLLSLVSRMIFDVTSARETNMKCFEQRMDILQYLLAHGGKVRDIFHSKLLKESGRQGKHSFLKDEQYSANTVIEYIQKDHRYDAANKELQQLIAVLQKHMDAQDLEKKKQ
jgi:hypothetical protein